LKESLNLSSQKQNSIEREDKEI